jgi:hypothetical protein
MSRNVPRGSQAEEELETAEPLAEEIDEGSAGGKIAGRKDRFGGGAPKMPEPTKPGDGQIVLASAKYLQRDPEPELRREQQRRESRERAEQEQADRSFEGNVFNGGVLGGAVAMLVAVVWFFLGLMNDVLFFYPPILFVIGLGAFFKGLMKGE